MAGDSIWKKGWGLGAELTISLVLLVVFSTGISGLILARLYQNNLLAAKAGELTLLANALALPLTGEALQGGQARYYRAALIRQADLTGAVLTDWQGRQSILAGRALDPALGEPIAPGESRVRIAEGSFWRFKEPPFIAVSVPAASGSLEVWLNFEEFTAHKRVVFFILAASMLINGLAAYCFSRIFINRRLIAPIRRLARDLADLAAGRFKPEAALASVYPGEMGWLFSSFNKTARTLIKNREDLTKHLETIKKAQSRLIQSEKMASVGRLTAGLAHEFGNPLGAVVGMIYLLKRDDLSVEERQQFLDRSISELDRMGGLIRSLLNFSRPSKAVVGPLSLDLVIDEALALARHQKWCQGVDLEKKLTGEPAPVLAERNLLLQVLLNLLANAGQALAGQAKSGRALIRVTAAYENGRALVTVADNGPGFNPADLPHLFEPFFTRKAPGEGTGLGLSICHSIVANFGGRLEARNSAEGGAELIFGLPMGEPGSGKAIGPDPLERKGGDDDADKR